MCGIVGYVGNQAASKLLLQGLQRLEYRGYDSAGVALFQGNHIEIRKSEGRLQKVESLLEAEPKSFLESTCGIGHTRWATHGRPTTQNAHPHRTGHVVLVHNGIIENYLEIKREILKKGHTPVSETDSELFGFLVLDEMNAGASLEEAVRKSFTQLHGQCSVVVMSEKEPYRIVGVRNGSPLVAAIDPAGGAFLASDAQPLLQISQSVFFMEHGDVCIADRTGLQFKDLATGKTKTLKPTTLSWTADQLERGGYPHFMLKEIHEQPHVLADTINGLLNRESSVPFALNPQPGLQLLEFASELIFVACGTSWHACLVGKYWIEKLARIPVTVELASEFRYRDPVIRKGAVVIGVSQSGETADTLAVLREMRLKGVGTLGISNVRGSSISREASDVFYTSAGPEIGVAATKTFTSQLALLFLFAGFLASKNHKTPESELLQYLEGFLKLPLLLANELSEGSQLLSRLQDLTERAQDVKGYFFIGRGLSFPLALEGALKLKEIAYDHAEGYAAGELKHGPIAMIDQGWIVVVLAPQDHWRDKTVANLEEVKARGATIVGVGNENDHDLQSLTDYWIPLPPKSDMIHSTLYPFLVSPVIQLMSYLRAVKKGTDVDKPRNLAKSVTVE